MKGAVKIGYWDTEAGERPPALLGQVQGTPTIRAFKPAKKGKKKIPVDYNGAREVKPMKDFLEYHMPNFVEPINGNGSLEKFFDKAEKFALPTFLLFSKSKYTKPLIKALSAEYRRRLLIGEVKNTANNKAIYDKFEVTAPPFLARVDRGGKHLDVFNKKPTFNRLSNFFGDGALKKPVKKAAAKQQSGEKSKQEL